MEAHIEKTTGAGSLHIHFITILYKSESCLPQFLECLLSQDDPDWRLHVIDNASPDGSANILRDRLCDKRISLTTNAKNLGFAKAANQGLQIASDAGGEFFVLINSDISFENDFCRNLRNARSKLRGGVIAPRIMRAEEPGAAWYAGGKLDKGWIIGNVHFEYDPSSSQSPVKVDFATGCCLGIPKDVLLKAGLLDERYFVYWEDTDFCVRLSKKGIPIYYVPDVYLSHRGGVSSDGEFSHSYVRLFYCSYMQFLRKNFGLKEAVSTALKLLIVEFRRKQRAQGRAEIMAAAMMRGLTRAGSRIRAIDEKVPRRSV